MGQPKLEDQPVKLHKQKEDAASKEHKDVNLSGTLASVTFLGLFILISWLGVWALFMIR